MWFTLIRNTAIQISRPCLVQIVFVFFHLTLIVSDCSMELPAVESFKKLFKNVKPSMAKATVLNQFKPV